MKPKYSSIALTSIVLCMFSANAADITWDTDAAAGIQGGPGNWNTTTDTNWTIDGGATRVAWNNVTGASNTAVLGTTGGAVAVSGTINLQGVKVTSGGYTVSGGTLNFGSALGSLDTLALGTTGANVFTVGSPLTGTGGLTIASHGNLAASGSGSSARLDITGNNTGLTGGITITAGIVQFGSQASAGSNAIALSNASGLVATGPVLVLNNNISFGTGGGTLRTYGSSNLFLTGTISGPGGFNRTDGGLIELTGPNTFTGKVVAQAGTLAATSFNNVGGGSTTSALGAPTTVADGTIDIGGSGQPTLMYLGNGESSDRVINFTTGSGGIVTQNGTGTLNLTSDLTGTNAGMAVVINGGGIGAMKGMLNTTALLNFVKQGPGNWKVNGNLQLNGGNLRPQGGILDFTSTSSTTGDVVIASTPANRANGGVVRIATGSSVKTADANTNGILGGWATVDNNTWAVSNGTGNAITGLASLTNDTWAAGTNTDVTLGGADPASGSTTNSLRFNAGGAKSLTLAGTNTLTSGGLLVTPNVGANAITIAGGTLAGANAADLIVHQNNAAGSLTISSVIANNTAATGVTKTGAGALVLNGANSYTGTTRVFEGKLTVNANSGGKIYEVASAATLELGYDTGLTVYGYGATVYGAGTAATTGLYLNGGNALTLTSTLRLAGSPTTVRTYGTGDAILQSWDSNPTMLQVDATASGSVLVSTIQLLATNYGYRMNILPGQFSATGDVTIQGPLTGTLPYIKVGFGSAKLTGASTNLNRFDLQQGSIILSGGDNRLASGSSLNLGNGTSSGSLVLNGITQTLTGLSITGTGTQNSIVGSSATLSTLVVNNSAASTLGVILGGSGANQNNLALVKNNIGVLSVTGANTYTGGTTISAGTLSLGSPGALGVSGTISLNGGTLQFTAANTTDYTVGGRLKVEDGVTTSLDTNGLDVAIGNPVAYGVSGTGVLTKTGAGALTLNYSVLNASKLSDTAPLGLAGGILRLAGGSHQEIVGSTVVTGNTSIERTSGSATINLGNVSRTGLATLNIASDGIVRTSTANDGSGKLPAWITVNGAPAANDGSGNIVAYSAFADIFRLGGKIPSNPAANIRIINGGASGNITLLNSGLSDISTLLQNATAGPAVVDLGSNNTLRLGESAAVIVPSGSGNLTITGGTLTAGGVDDMNGQFAIDSDQSTVIASMIDDNGGGVVSLSKSGDGSLELAQENTYTGGTTLISGQLLLGNDFSLGFGRLTINGGSFDNSSGGALYITDPIPQTWNANVNFTGTDEVIFANTGAPVTLTANQTVTVANSALTIAGAVNGAYALTKAGNGMLSLGGGSWTGLTTVTGGTLEVLGKSPDAPYVVNSGTTLKLGYTTAGAYTATNLKVYGDGVAATTGLYFKAGASYNGSGTIELLGAPTTIRHYESGLASIGMFDINGTAIRTVPESSGSVIDSEIQFISFGYGMSVDIAVGSETATGDLVMNGPLNVNRVDGGLYKRGAGSLALNGIATADNKGVIILGGSVICGVPECLGANATLNISSGAKLNVNGTHQTVASLVLNGVTKANGTWGSEDSAATNKDNTYFSGTGVVQVGSGGYNSWAAINAPSGTAQDDYDGDGVSNGVEYVVGGTKDTNDLDKLPKLTSAGADLVFTFVRDQQSIDGTTVLNIETGINLVDWPNKYPVSDTAVVANPGVTVTKNTPVAGKDTVVLTVPRAPDTKKFGRLNVKVAP